MFCTVLSGCYLNSSVMAALGGAQAGHGAESYKKIYARKNVVSTYRSCEMWN